MSGENFLIKQNLFNFLLLLIVKEVRGWSSKHDRVEFYIENYKSTLEDKRVTSKVGERLVLFINCKMSRGLQLSEEVNNHLIIVAMCKSLIVWV